MGAILQQQIVEVEKNNFPHPEKKLQEQVPEVEKRKQTRDIADQDRKELVKLIPQVNTVLASPAGATNPPRVSTLMDIPLSGAILSRFSLGAESYRLTTTQVSG